VANRTGVSVTANRQPSGAPPNRPTASLAIGQRIRDVRNAKGLSLRALATEVGVTASLLSQVENGQVNPSLDTLLGLATCLTTPVSQFFVDDHPSAPECPTSSEAQSVVRAGARDHLAFPDGVTWENLLSQSEPDLEWVLITYPPHTPDPPPMLRHGGKDYGLVLSGQLSIALAFDEQVLGPGDSIAFDGTTPHRVWNPTDQLATAAWFIRDRHRAD
jgi:transcriptional regulator with XRE-family HTH domain